VKKEFEYRGCYICSPEDTIKLGNTILPLNKQGNCQLNPAYVGQSARTIAEKSGITVPADHPCKVIIGECSYENINL